MQSSGSCTCCLTNTQRPRLPGILPRVSAPARGKAPTRMAGCPEL